MLEDLSGVRLLVVGDVMLDRYWFGEVSRISPEAPVPVVKIERVEERPGGAANVARNAAALGAQVTLLAVIGDDEAGNCLQRLVAEDEINADWQIDHNISTTVKLRVVGRQQQLLRVDFEKPPSLSALKAKLSSFAARVAESDAVIFSDYGKGGLADIGAMIALAREADKIVLVDPKGDDFAPYFGATVVTPNSSEMKAVVGSWRSEEELKEKAVALREKFALEALLVTRSEEGMTLFHSDQVLHEKAVAREVFDVSGAGDTVIATLAVMLAQGAEWARAIEVANRAAGIVVGKLGTAVVNRSELAHALDLAE